MVKEADVRRKNATFSISPVTPMMLKACTAAPPYSKEQPQPEGRLIDDLLEREFFRHVYNLVLHRRSGVIETHDPIDRVFSWRGRSVAVIELAIDGIHLRYAEDTRHSLGVVPYDPVAVATSIAGFLRDGFAGDPRMRGFPDNAIVWFLPMSGKHGEVEPVALTFIAGVDVRNYETLVSPDAPMNVGHYANVITTDGTELSGRIASINRIALPNDTSVTSLALTALGQDVRVNGTFPA